MRKEHILEILKSQKDYLNTLIASFDRSEDSEPIDIDDFLNPPFFDSYRYRRLENELREIKHLLRRQQRLECPLIHNQELNTLGLITLPTQRDNGLKEIREFTNNTSDLIVIDPYIYGGEAIGSSSYIDEFIKSSRLQKIKKLHIIYSSRHGNTGAIKKGIKEAAQNNKCQFSEIDNDSIHDRIWIADRTRAIVVGTSLGGLGNKVCFILPLPKNDLDDLLQYLDDNGLSRSR